jgi:hypothetical protein
MQHSNLSSLSRPNKQERNPSPSEDTPLLSNERMNELYGTHDQHPAREIISPGNQMSRIAAAQAAFDNTMAIGKRRGKIWTVGLLISIGCLTASSYICDQESDEIVKRAYLIAALGSSLSVLITGGMSLSYCCWKENKGGDYASAILRSPNFEEQKTRVLEVTRSVGIDIEDTGNPSQLNAGLQRAQEKATRISNQRFAFLSGDHPRLGANSTVCTLFKGLDSGGRGKARDVICEKIFKLAEMNL